MSHPNFAALPEGVRSSAALRGDTEARSWRARLGVSQQVSALNLVSFLIHAAASICFLVFLNASQPFIIAQLGVTEGQGALSGSLVFSDELLSMPFVLLWGSLSDILGTKLVAVVAYCFVAAGFGGYVLAQHAWPDLLVARLVFAVGGSGVTAMLTAILASYSSTQPRSVAGTQVEASPDNQDETSSLLSANEAEYDPESRGASSVHDPFDGRSRNSNAQAKHGRLAGLAGLSTGLGALVAVFALLRLPVLLAGRHDRDTDPEEGLDPTIRRGTRETYLIVAALALGVAVFLALGLRTDLPYAPSAKKARRSAESTDLENSDIARHASSSAYGAVESSALPDARAARRERLKRRLARLSYAARARASIFELAHGAVYGFSLAGKNRRLPLAYFGGALARASTIGTTVFVPLLVTRFYYTSGLCSTLPSPDIPPSELKRTCRQAFALASALSGVIQLCALLLSPVAGLACDALSAPVTLLITSALGTASFLALGVGLPGEGDPRAPIAWVAAVGIGACQIGAIVGSMALCAQARRMEGGKGGAIAGCYSFFGGLSILVISKLGGLLFDMYAPAPFLLVAGLAGITTLWAAVVVVLERRESVGST